MKTLTKVAILSGMLLAGGCASDRPSSLAEVCGPTPAPECVALVLQVRQARMVSNLAYLQSLNANVQAMQATRASELAAMPRTCVVVPNGTGATVKGSYAYCQ